VFSDIFGLTRVFVASCKVFLGWFLNAAFLMVGAGIALIPT